LIRTLKRGWKFFARDADLHAADAARDRQDWAAARDAYARVLARNAADPAIWVQYGHMLKETRGFEAAEAAYRRALAAAPAKADTHLQLGHLYKVTGRLHEALLAYGEAARLAPGLTDAERELRWTRRQIGRSDGLPERLRYVIIGTTGLCNASCVHCPTGKAETAHVPKTPMPMALFRRIVDQMREMNFEITDQVSFGLFGDGLVDPYVVQRAEYLRQAFPDVRLSVNTNGAAYSRAKHAALVPLVSVLALHCEALDGEVYNYLMQPLRLDRVLPKFEDIFADFGRKVLVSVPVSRANYPHLDEIRDYFSRNGVGEVVFDALASRCAEDASLFNRLALRPMPIRCAPDIFDDLIVDSDGMVLACCQDFRRLEPIGDLAADPLDQVLKTAARLRMREAFADGRHTDYKNTCNICFGDARGETLPQQDWRPFAEVINPA
jgi:tetratricopeptide (TPR) repeat protein